MAQKKLLLIDGNSVAFRAFYALYRQLDRLLVQMDCIQMQFLLLKICLTQS